MNTQKYRLFNQLKDAIEADDILAATTRCIWEADGMAEGDARCRVPSLQELQTFTQPVEPDKRFIIGEDTDRYKIVLFLRSEDLQKNVLLTDEEKATLQETLDLCQSIRQGDVAAQEALAKDILPQVLKATCSEDDPEGFFKILNVLLTDQQKAAVRKTFDSLKLDYQGDVAAQEELTKGISPDDENFHRRRAEYISPKVIELIASGQLAPNESVERILSEILSDRLSAFANEFGTLPVETFEPLANHLLRVSGEPSAERLEWLHQAWRLALEQDTKLSHPIVPLLRAWMQQQSAKRVTLDYDKKHPISVLKHPLGSIRDVSLVELGETAHLREFATPNSSRQVESTQLQLFDPTEKNSILPAIMPLQIAHPMGLKPKTKAGAVSHEIRIFFEALMALEPTQQQVDMMFRLGDLIHYLYPDGKFNRTNQLPYIINALEVLHFYATVPWRDDQGDLRRWRPVHVKSPLESNSKNETPVFMRVEMPPDAKQGMAVDKQILRGLGKASAPQFNAYLTAAYLWDKYGTHQGKIIDPTRPVERRNSENALVDENGKPLVNPRGKEITNLYDPHAVKQSEREPNPDAIKRYPVLSNEDLIYACFPNTTTQNLRVLLKRAQTHWTELEKAGIVRIERSTHGWRILPGVSHIERYRGVKETQKGG